MCCLSVLARNDSCGPRPAGCMFVATNTDGSDKLEGERRMPGTGGLVAAVQIASGVDPVRPGPSSSPH